MYVRILKSIQDYGILVKKEEIESVIDNPDTDWYISVFDYGEEAYEYFKNNVKEDKDGNEVNSIKGYKGEVSTPILFWDIDSEDDISIAQDATIDLINFLIDEFDVEDSIEVYYSGKKGFHILLKGKEPFTNEEVKRICHNIANDSGLLELNKELDKKIYDPVVYNVNRVLRAPNTKHPDSGLYKIQLKLEDLELDIEDIQKKAKKRSKSVPASGADLEFLKEKYKKKAKNSLELVNNVIDFEEVKAKYSGDFNPLDCPPDKRRCIYVLENGYFGPGERENASIRLAAYYKGLNWTEEQTFEKILIALRRRDQIYPDLNPWTEADIHRVVSEVFGEGWNGGTYSCKSDYFLSSKCDIGNGPCSQDSTKKLHVVTIGGLIDQYIQYGMEALADYPKTGLEWVDTLVRFRPRNYSIVNGANGSAKTSFCIQWMEHLNSQEMYHLFFSADMANTSLFEKIGARHTTYKQEQIEKAFNKHTADYEIQREVMEALKEHYPFTIFDFTSALTASHMESTIRNLQDLGYKVQIAFIDYAGRVVGDNDSAYQNATQIALEGNDIAKRTSTHLCFISQVPREEGDHTRPLRSSRVSKDSGAWEENATAVINIWRPFGDGLDDLDNYIHFYVAKNRSGSLGEHVFWWEGKTGEISEISEEEFQKYKNLCEQMKKEPPKEQYEYRSKDIEKLVQSGRFKPKTTKEDDGDDSGQGEELPDNRKSKRSRRSSRYS